MKNINKLLGERVREYRKRLRITQEQLAEKCGKSLATIQLLETGKTWPELDTVQKLATVLHVEEDAFFRSESETVPAPVAPHSPDLLRELLAILSTLNDDEMKDALHALRRSRAHSKGLLGELPNEEAEEANVLIRPTRKRQ